jgi:hypothetical protein
MTRENRHCAIPASLSVAGVPVRDANLNLRIRVK